MSGVARRCAAALQKYLRREGDAPADVRRKFALAVYLACGTLGGGWIAAATPDRIGMILLGGVGFLLLLIWLLERRRAGIVFLGAVSLHLITVIVYYDMLNGALGRQGWPLCVVLLDVLLVARAPSHVTHAVVGTVLVWVFVVELEFATRSLGLFDVPWSPPYAQRSKEWTSCAKPPCPHNDVPEMLRRVLPAVFVFVVDYALTRGFSRQVAKEEERMAAAVKAAEDIARALSKFDLEAAGAALTLAEDDLPADLHASYDMLLLNLARYRPYLPSYFFVNRERAEANPLVPPGVDDERPPRLARTPSVDNACVAVVYASLQVPTAVQEETYATYRAIVRSLAGGDGAREIRAIGNSCLVAFASAARAVAFGKGAQDAWATTRWPSGLSWRAVDMESGCVGTCVGVDFGKVARQQSTLTGGVELYGEPVDRAVAVGRAGLIGTVSVTEAVLLRLQEECPADAGDDPLPYAAAAHAASGLVAMWAVVPPLLKSRTDVIQERCEGRVVAASVIRASPHRSNASLGSTFSMCVSSFTDSEGGHAGSPAGLRARTARSAATLCSMRYVVQGTVRGPLDWDGIERGLTDGIAALHSMVQLTDGHVGLVMNDMVLMSWGVYGECMQHVNQSARFLMMWEGRQGALGGGGRPLYHAGLATGPVACGTMVVSATERHVTPMGPCVNAALMLSVGAAETQAQALVATLAAHEFEGYERSGFLRGHLWPVDSWPLAETAGWGAGKYEEDGVTVYELDVRSAAAAVPDIDHIRMDEGEGDCAAAEYRKAYACRDAAKVKTFAPQYPPAAAVAQRLAHGTHLPHQLVLAVRVPPSAQEGPECALSASLSDTTD